MNAASAAPQRFGFIGVTTRGSLINQVFPLWNDCLGLNARLEGIDVPVGADRETLRNAVQRLQQEPGWAGALVTTHKVAVWEHARDLLAEADPHATQLGEVSCLSRNPSGQWVGHAKDVFTAQQAFDQLVPLSHWKEHPEAELCILGAGGAGVALGWGVRQREHAPARLTFTERAPERLDQVAHHLQAPANQLHLVHATDASVADTLVSTLPEHSVIVNATGLGKDRPGSPLSAGARFPRHSLAWELNYRGDLLFLQQARAQQGPQSLQVSDGWNYFLLGWAYVTAEVFHFELTPERLQTLLEVAAPLRP